MDTEPSISFDDFLKIEMRVGTVRSAKRNEKAKKPAYILEIDFGQFGVKTSSAQITEAYQLDELIGSQVIAVTNFPPKRVAGVKSEVLVLAVVEEDGRAILLRPTQKVENGMRVA
ncbi:tRNA-binding protein [Roseofilum casamattae]|uniref:tRNA-binding protein n=1 Tax=Roseofilum casamattae BLCC-M143 TaxID=3022442 RepID=A0ABT7BU91_9CYAN|nr:tRNA-binding protein [Roseofilum casamattae]MDJ1182758.1 tRNA-binding protein [Roseofilum casamattae BLCC-M143]